MKVTEFNIGQKPTPNSFENNPATSLWDWFDIIFSISLGFISYYQVLTQKQLIT